MATVNQDGVNGIKLSSSVTMLPPRTNNNKNHMPHQNSSNIPTRIVENETLPDAHGNMGVYNGPVMMVEQTAEHPDLSAATPNPLDDPDAPPPPLTEISLEDETPPLPHGKYGQMVYMDHDEYIKYTGDWEQGLWTRGTLLYANGNVYTGPWNEQAQPHGPNGKMEWVVRSSSAHQDGGEDTRTYLGDWDNGMRHGQGTYTFSRTAAVYQGAFFKNQRHGYGTYRDPSTNIEYIGEWQQGLYQGYGQYTWIDSRSKQKQMYRGHFSMGKPHGEGIQESASGKVFHDGEWAQGKPLPGTNKQSPSKAAVTPTSTPVSKTTPESPTAVQTPSREVSRLSMPTPIAPATTTPVPNRGTPNPRNNATTPMTKVRHIPAPGMTPPPPKAGSVTVVHDREWMDTVNQNKPCLGIYRGLWLKQNPYQNGVVMYQSGEVESYEGWFNQQGYFHGTDCRLTFRNGDEYRGDFSYGQRHGQGLYTWRDGRQYKGQFIKNSREGKGTLVYPNSDFYEGSFVQGRRHGKGRFIFANGSMFEGSWSGGQYHGSGTLVQHDGSTYVGMFENGFKHGEGKDLNAMGKVVYEGKYFRGKPADESDPTEEEEEGQGANSRDTHSEKQQNPAQAQQYQRPSSLSQSSRQPSSDGSYWIDDDTEGVIPPNIPAPQTAPHSVAEDEPPCEAVVDRAITDCQGNEGRFTGLVLVSTKRPHGVGRLVYSDGKRIHEGFWVNGSKEGHGRCLFFPQGDFHEGEYQNNLRNGPGRYQWKDGRLFLGSYKDDMRHGKGVFQYPSGDRYEGMFIKGQRSGFGKFRFQGGSYEGEWVAGKYHGHGKLLWGRGTTYEGDFANGTFHGAGTLRNESGDILEQGRWFRGKRVVSESPTAAPPAAAPPLAPETPVNDPASENDVEPPILHEESRDGDDDTGMAVATEEENGIDSVNFKEKKDSKVDGSMTVATAAENSLDSAHVKEETDSKVDGSLTPSTVDSYVVDDETPDDSKDSNEDGSVVQVSSPSEEEMDKIAGANAKDVPTTAVEI